jgi:beta-glucanase (GH16 family)
MKKKIFLLIPLASVFFLLFSCNEKNKEEWQLVWEENFDYKDLSEADALWSKIPRGGSDWNNFMSDNDSCFDFRNGNLVLRGIPNTLEPDDTAKVLTGGVWTKGKKAFINGRMEFRAKFGEAQGAWPAIWMMPEGLPWPQGGEIDVVEHLNFDSIAYQTIHTPFTLAGNEGPKQSVTHPIKRNDYNVYAVELYPDSLRFFINDELTLCYPKVEELGPDQFPFTNEFYILISNQVGGNWVGAYDTEQLPVEIYVDWIRFYQREGEN